MTGGVAASACVACGSSFKRNARRHVKRRGALRAVATLPPETRTELHGLKNVMNVAGR